MAMPIPVARGESISVAPDGRDARFNPAFRRPFEERRQPAVFMQLFVAGAAKKMAQSNDEDDHDDDRADDERVLDHVPVIDHLLVVGWVFPGDVDQVIFETASARR